MFPGEPGDDGRPAGWVHRGSEGRRGANPQPQTVGPGGGRHAHCRRRRIHRRDAHRQVSCNLRHFICGSSTPKIYIAIAAWYCGLLDCTSDFSSQFFVLRLPHAWFILMCPLTKPDWMTLIEAEALTGMKSVLSVISNCASCALNIIFTRPHVYKTFESNSGSWKEWKICSI